MDEALARVSPQLVWDEREQVALDAACAAADRIERLTSIANTEGIEPTELVKVSAELRMLEKHQTDMLARLSFTTEPAKSARHQRAVNARWQRRDAEWAAAREGSA
ncbi:hypothetical protein [Mycobacterium bourgelatii]|nr:hypothetical protein [Mycobacterium bourgelatii]